MKPADRTRPVSFEGEDLDGDPLAVQDYRGKVVVVVVWGSWCPPCRAEAPWTVEAADELGGDVQVVGINIRDGSTTAPLAMVRRFGIDYPSFFSPDGEALLSFPGGLSPRTIPATVVLDREGRIAASVVGPLPSKQTLVDLTEAVVEEPRDG